MTSSESGSEGVREEIEAQVRVATAELRRQLQVLQVQVAELQRHCQTKVSGPGADMGMAGKASWTQMDRPHTAREVVLPRTREELAYDYAQATEEEVEGDDDEAQEIEDLPETLFAYCMARLATHPGSIVEPVVYLLLQICIQLGLALSFTNAALGRFFDLYWNGLPETPELCLYQENVIMKHPYQDVLAAICCFFLAAVGMMADDKERLSSIYPDRTHSLRVRAVVTIAWCIEGFVVPVLLLSSISVLMVNSLNALDVVMNGLAVLFIVDVDDMLYACVPLRRRDELKEQLLTQQSACSLVRLEPAHLEFDAAIMCAHKFLYMVFTYFSTVYMTSAVGKGLAEEFLKGNSGVSVLDEAFRFCMLPLISTFAWHKPSDARGTIATIGRAIFTIVFGAFLPTSALMLLHSRFLGTPSLLVGADLTECYVKPY